MDAGRDNVLLAWTDLVRLAAKFGPKKVFSPVRYQHWKARKRYQSVPPLITTVENEPRQRLRIPRGRKTHHDPSFDQFCRFPSSSLSAEAKGGQLKASGSR